MTFLLLPVLAAIGYSQTPGGSQGGLLSGSVVSSQPTNEILRLSLREAIERGLRYNLGIATSEQATRLAASARLQALSLLLPSINGRVSETSQQVNLKAFGFGGFPGVPDIVGPFSVFDARAALTQSIFNFAAIAGYSGVRQQERAARYSFESTRDAVVLAVTSLYLQAQSAVARVSTAEAQVKVAQAALDQARNMNRAGVVAGIDVLRAQVELQNEQSVVINSRAQLDRARLDLGRAIGLLGGQRIELTSDVPYAQPPVLSIEDALSRAISTRPDYQAALATEAAAAALKRAARMERLPSAAVAANYGAIGPSPVNAHGTYTAGVALDFPIFDGGRIRADVERADAELQQRRAETSNLRGVVDYEVRTAFLDLNAARDRVELAQSTVKLAEQQLTQARDRFQAGVTNNLEVVQAQAAVVGANESLISSLFAYNVAKASLARAVGTIQRTIYEFLGVQP